MRQVKNFGLKIIGLPIKRLFTQRQQPRGSAHLTSFAK